MPAELRGELVALIAGMHAGGAEAGAAAIEPLRALGPAVDAFAPVGYAEFQCSIDDPPGHRNYWTAVQLGELDEATIAEVDARAAEMPGSAPQIFCVAWGGAIERFGTETSPLTGRSTRFIVHPLMMWDDPADDDAVIAWSRAFRDALRDREASSAYLNFTSEIGEEQVRSQFDPASYARLAEVKRRWDPTDTFRGSGHVPPAAVGS